MQFFESRDIEGGGGLQGCAERSIIVSNDMSMRIVDKGETLRLLNEQSRGLVFTRLQVFGSTLYEHTASVPRFHQQLRPLQEHGTAHAGTISVISTGRVVPVLATPLASLADACSSSCTRTRSRLDQCTVTKWSAE